MQNVKQDAKVSHFYVSSARIDHNLRKMYFYLLHLSNLATYTTDPSLP